MISQRDTRSECLKLMRELRDLSHYIVVIPATALFGLRQVGKSSSLCPGLQVLCCCIERPTKSEKRAYVVCTIF